MTAQRTKTAVTSLATAIVALLLLLGSESPRNETNRWGFQELTWQQARDLAGRGPGARIPARAAATWCGTPSAKDLVPNGVAGNPVHWVYMTPADEPDQLPTYASIMQTDAEAIDAWWRGQDPTRAPRNDVAASSCGLQVDLTTIRLGQPGAQLVSVETRADTIANSLVALGFGSRHTKYVVYYDGPVEPEICGQGGSDDSGLGFAMVYVRACLGVPFATTAAHELLHTMGAVADGAPNNCPEPNDGHVCDDPYDMMFPFGDETPIGGLALDSGRNDYYGHSGSWPDAQDSPWLLHLDRQIPLNVTMTGPGMVVADVPGLRCTETCTTAWNADTTLTLSATPAAGSKLVRWGSACSGSGSCSVAVASGRSVSALFAPLTYRLTVAVAGKGTVRSSRPGIACSPRCSASVSSHEPLQLRAKASQGSRFKSWKGACRGAKPTCTVPMSGDTRVQAVFVKA